MPAYITLQNLSLEPPYEPPYPARLLEVIETKETINTVLGILDTRQRQALVLQYALGLNLKEVGEELGITREAARQLIARALSSMRSPRIWEVTGETEAKFTNDLKREILLTLERVTNSDPNKKITLRESIPTLAEIVEKAYRGIHYWYKQTKELRAIDNRIRAINEEFSREGSISDHLDKLIADLQKPTPT